MADPMSQLDDLTRGDHETGPIVHIVPPGCPAHSDNWLYAAVRNNRRLSGLPPQECACARLTADLPITDEAVEAARDELAGWQIGSGYYATQVAVDEALDMARAALEAALPLIVDDLRANPVERLQDEAEALEEAADAMDADPSFRDPLRLKSDWLRARAARIRGGGES